MRAIKVTYRAVFRQPIGVLNPMGMKLNGPIAVEVFGTGEKWQARELTTGAVFTRLKYFPGVDNAICATDAAFETREQPWQMWGKPPDEPVARMLNSHEIAQADGKVFFKQAEDYTHILHAPTTPAGARIPPAACGEQVNAKCFINNRANVEPTCRSCAEVWRKEYQGK